MAAKRGKRRGPNKAQAIRDTLKELGRESAPKVVRAELAKKRINVSAAQVSNIKAELSRLAGDKPSRGRRKTTTNGEISLATLLEVKRMAEKFGGVDYTRRALDALVQLR